MKREDHQEAQRIVAMRAVRKACELCQSVRDTLVSAEALAKKDKSPVTVADFGAQAIIIDELTRAYPEVLVVGEEDASALCNPTNAAIKDRVVEQVRRVDSSLDEPRILQAIDRGAHDGGSRGRFWTLDPIDGTKGFLRGEQYAIALALIEEGQVTLGVLGCPNLPWVEGGRGPTTGEGQACGRGCLFVASRDRGAFLYPLQGGGGTQVRVTEVTDPARASFCESVESGHSSHGDAARIAALLGVTAPPFRIDSQCKYAAVARGDASIYLRLPTSEDYREKIWDHAAGWMVVKEAGGEVSDVRGRPLDFAAGRTLSRNQGVVATNGRLHDQVIAVVRETLRI
ncbi:MAG TPA: 3'(2'),5'-bisphosphate nucleotidase [Phycisphaerae bacterium]|nr:3'(2'),5'-bisphosphate nucleotidase [Phycisphaerae bacterium]HRY67029.1 3'(2'),5'-bisphosphate nucleotidase [Phycisphaerae bacterium]HSA27726.1 3'(2'),5'-bisphosphate nucleotidase [Phycisphaerae bacterium]